MAGLTYTLIASSAADGPLVSPALNAAELAYLLAANRQALLTYVNGSLQRAEASLPEGTRVELAITGWMVAGRSQASYVAAQLNAQAAAGDIRQPDGELVQAWPEYPGQIAWGDDATDTVTIRTVKGQQWLAYVVIGILAILAAAIVIGLLSGAKWAARSAQFLSGIGQVASWLLTHWEVPLLVLAAGAAAPLVIRQVARVREAENELTAAERGAY